MVLWSCVRIQFLIQSRKKSQYSHCEIFVSSFFFFLFFTFIWFLAVTLVATLSYYLFKLSLQNINYLFTIIYDRLGLLWSFLRCESGVNFGEKTKRLVSLNKKNTLNFFCFINIKHNKWVIFNRWNNGVTNDVKLRYINEAKFYRWWSPYPKDSWWYPHLHNPDDDRGDHNLHD